MSDKPKGGYAEQILKNRGPAEDGQADGLEPRAEKARAGSPVREARVRREPSASKSTEEGDSFSTANPPRRQKHVRLNFVMKDDTEVSFPYFDLRPIRFDAKARIVLEYPGLQCTVTLAGRNLKKLKRRLDREEVGTIQEVDELADKATGDDKATAVYRILVEELGKAVAQKRGKGPASAAPLADAE